MFEIGFSELVLVAIVTLLVMGPERLPVAVRTARLWSGRLRHSWQKLREDMERSIDTDEIKRELHNDAVLKGLKDTGYDLRSSVQQADDAVRKILPPDPPS